jgi:hypothetical protein
MVRLFPDLVEEAETSILIGIPVFVSMVGMICHAPVGMWESPGLISIQTALEATNTDTDGI